MNDNSNEFYDSIYHINQHGNKCLFTLAVILSIAISAACIYMFIIFL